VIRETVQKVEKWIGWDEEQAGGRATTLAERINQGFYRGRMLLKSKINEGKRGGAAGKSRGSEEDSWERRVTHGSSQEATTTTHQSKHT
jgi:hypothetical protein